jgi:glycine/D-amino acid oxidase-like deaminating enzyme
MKNGLIRTYNPLDSDLDVDVCVIGGGITGAFLSRAAVLCGRTCAVLDRRNIAHGSTAASTALLQYEIDLHLTELAEKIGEDAALLAYRASRDSLPAIEAVCREIGYDEFEWNDSIYFASRSQDVEAMRADFELRRRHGFDVEWLGPDDFKKRFDFPSDGAIRSRAAQVDAYRLAHTLFNDVASRGGQIFARVQVDSIDERSQDIVIHTDRGCRVRCRRLVVACGYESLTFLKTPPDVDLNSTYAFVTEPLETFSGWEGREMFWESARPYAYARVTPDGRGILGGEDVRFRNPAARDALLPHKEARLEKRWKELFPRIPLEIASTWTGTFAETQDGLPFVGSPLDQPNLFFALCYGGNGIVFSAIAGEMLTASLRGEPHPCGSIFRFGR